MGLSKIKIQDAKVWAGPYFGNAHFGRGDRGAMHSREHRSGILAIVYFLNTPIESTPSS